MDRYTVRGRDTRLFRDGAIIVEFHHVPLTLLAEIIDSVAHTLSVAEVVVVLEKGEK